MKKSMKCTICVLLILALMSPVFTAAAASIPALTVSRAVDGFLGEVDARLDTTPLAAFGKLAALFKDSGSLGLELDVNDYGDEMTLDASIAWDVAANAAMFDLAMTGGANFDASVYADGEQMAVRLGALGEDYYGLEFASFREDVESIGPELVPETVVTQINEILDVLEQVGEPTVSGFVIPEGYGAQYSELIGEFLMANEKVYENEAITAGGKTVNTTKVEYKYSHSDIVALLEDLVALLAEDELMAQIIEMYGSSLVQTYEPTAVMFNTTDELYAFLEVLNEDMSEEERAELVAAYIEAGLVGTGDEAVEAVTYSVYFNLVNSLKEAVAIFAEEVEMDITLSFNVSQERVYRAALVINTNIYGIDETANIVLDTGASATDTWSLKMSYSTPDSYYSDTVYTYTWDYNLKGTTHTNKLTYTNEYGNMFDSYISREYYTSVWNEADGAFTLGYANYWDEQSISGVYLPDDNGGFSVDIDLGDEDYTWSLSVTATAGAEITVPEYVTPDVWLPAALEAGDSVDIYELLGIEPYEYTYVAPEPVFAEPTSAKVFVDGVEVNVAGYSYMGSDFFRLRDLAVALNGTEKQFDIDLLAKYKMIVLLPGEAYTANGTECTPLPEGPRGDIKYSQSTLYYYTSYYWGGSSMFQTYATMYEFDYSNYLSLYDIEYYLDLNITFDEETNAYYIDTTRSYYDW